MKSVDKDRSKITDMVKQIKKDWVEKEKETDRRSNRDTELEESSERNASE